METREVDEKVNIKGIFEGETKALGDGVFEAIINTGKVDREGERLDVEGVDLRGYKQNAVVLYGHDYYSLPIGKSISVRKQDGNIISKFKLAVEEYDFAATVDKLIQGGYLNAVSIGVIVKEWSNDFKEILKSEMVEFSIVPVPADRGALITRSLAEIGKTEDQFRSEFKQFMRQHLVEKSTKDELEVHINNLKNLVALLEETHKESQNESAPKKIRVIKTVTLKKTAGQIVRESEQAVRLIKVSIRKG